MIYVALVGFGLLLGSFINALVWRLHEQASYKNNDGSSKKLSKADKERLRQLSISTGRSMCSHCGHQLAAKDLVPVLSWVWLRGKCRYCKKPIGDSPLAEIILPVLFVLSYSFWPYGITEWGLIDIASFGTWLVILTIGLALAMYDARWYLLPNRLVAPLTLVALLMAGLLAFGGAGWWALLWGLAGGAVIGGLFYLLFQMSDGEWIGGGDVKIGFALGVIAGSPLMACLVIFIASLLGVALMMPSIILRKRQMKSMLPFGPFLLVATLIVFLWGEAMLAWYQGLLIS